MGWLLSPCRTASKISPEFRNPKKGGKSLSMILCSSVSSKQRPILDLLFPLRLCSEKGCANLSRLTYYHMNKMPDAHGQQTNTLQKLAHAIYRDFLSCKNFVGFLAHLSRRLTGELIVYPCSGVRPSSSSTISKISETAEILCGASMVRVNESLFMGSWSHDQDGRHAHIW